MEWARRRTGRLTGLLVLGAIVVLITVGAYAAIYEAAPNHRQETVTLGEMTYTWRAIDPDFGAVTYGFDVPNGTRIDVMIMSAKNVEAVRNGEKAYYIGWCSILNESAGGSALEVSSSYYLVFGNNASENVTVNYWYDVQVSGATWAHRGLFVSQFVILYSALALGPYIYLRRKWKTQAEQGLVRPAGLLAPICPHCGGEVHGNPQFCMFCGHRLR